MKKLMLLAAMLAMVVLAASPALAQLEGLNNTQNVTGGSVTQTNTVTNSECVAILQNNNVPVQANQQNQSGFIEILTTDVQTAIQNASNTQTAVAIQKCVG